VQSIFLIIPHRKNELNFLTKALNGFSPFTEQKKRAIKFVAWRKIYSNQVHMQTDKSAS
jgi:hypothetical protein